MVRVQARVADGLDPKLKQWKSEKWLNSGSILKEEPAGSADGLDMACEK